MSHPACVRTAELSPLSCMIVLQALGFTIPDRLVWRVWWLSLDWPPDTLTLPLDFSRCRSIRLPAKRIVCRYPEAP